MRRRETLCVVVSVTEQSSQSLAMAVELERFTSQTYGQPLYYNYTSFPLVNGTLITVTIVVRVERLGLKIA